MGSVLLASATGSAATFGFAAGTAVTLMTRSDIGPRPAAALIVAAILLDAARVRAPAIRKQVPREWARLFSLPAAALLYGSRLGIGPFTILWTWLWWAGAVIAAFGGPWVSAAWHAAFAALRAAVMLSAGTIGASAMSVRMARIRRIERPAAMALAAAALASASAAWLSG